VIRVGGTDLRARGSSLRTTGSTYGSQMHAQVQEMATAWAQDGAVKPRDEGGHDPCHQPCMMSEPWTMGAFALARACHCRRYICSTPCRHGILCNYRRIPSAGSSQCMLSASCSASTYRALELVRQLKLVDISTSNLASISQQEEEDAGA